MGYCEEFTALRGLFHGMRRGETRLTSERDILIQCVPFDSRNGSLLPGLDEYRCTEHYGRFTEKLGPAARRASRGNPPSPLERMLHLEDAGVRENLSFTFPLFSPGEGCANGLIVLFHGLNERSWDKYLPWAAKLVGETGKAVALFPTAFHMNRAPREWSSSRLMRGVAEQRRRLFPCLSCSTFANAAISTRLQLLPQRFFWSGMQTYQDFLQLLGEVRAGEHPRIRRDATVDLFGYSIGAFLAELLLMIDPLGELSRSHLFLFCGGTTVDRMSPVSRYILDSEAAMALHAFFVQDLDEHLRRNERLAHFLGSEHPEGYYFRSMLDHYSMRGVREDRLREVGKRMRAVALAGDTVIRPEEVVTTLQGFTRDIPVEVEVEDFPYPYRHENPFPPVRALGEQVDRCFERVFGKAGALLG
jgi:hypothetical protein